MNKKILVAGIMMGGLMLFSGAVAKLISPTIKIADTRPAVAVSYTHLTLPTILLV